MISSLNLKKYFKVLILFLFILALSVDAKTNKNLVNIYFFHSSNCSHCNTEINFLDSLEKKYDNIRVHRYEVHESNNNEARLNVQKLYNIKSNGVPLTIIGDTPYMGYSENISNKNFIKTIEYYSRYGYEDKVGELLKIDNLTTYEVNENNPSLEEFIKEYGNYKLIGNLYTDNLDAISNAIILGILSQFNLIKIISIILILVLLERISCNKTKLILLTLYLITSLILNTVCIIPNYMYKLFIVLLFVIMIVVGIFKGLKNKRQKYLYNSLFIIIAVLGIYLDSYIYPTRSIAYTEVMILHNLSGINKVSYYANYLFIIVIINILCILMYSKYLNIKSKRGKSNSNI